MNEFVTCPWCSTDRFRRISHRGDTVTGADITEAQCVAMHWLEMRPPDSVKVEWDREPGFRLRFTVPFGNCRTLSCPDP